MEFLKIFIGLLALFLAWGFMFRAGLIYKINAWLKEHIFNDQWVLYSRRRLAILLFVLGLVALFSGIDNVVNDKKITPEAAQELITRAKDEFRQREYTHVINICRTLLRSDPKNIEAWEMIANAWWAVGERDKARNALKVILNLQPDNTQARKLLEIFSESKKGPAKK